MEISREESINFDTSAIFEIPVHEIPASDARSD